MKKHSKTIPIGKFLNYLTATDNIDVINSNDDWDRVIDLVNNSNGRTAYIVTGINDNLVDWPTVRIICTNLGVPIPHIEDFD